MTQKGETSTRCIIELVGNWSLNPQGFWKLMYYMPLLFEPREDIGVSTKPSLVTS